jgi:small subunit ribosomal protein S14
MLSLKLKDIKHRKNFKKFEKNKKIEKFLFTNFLNNPINKKHSSFLNNAFLLKFDFSKKGSKTLIVQRCVLTNRSRGVFRPFSISRIYLRELMQFGFIPGYKKAVW